MIDITESDDDRIWWSLPCPCGCDMPELTYGNLQEILQRLHEGYRMNDWLEGSRVARPATVEDAQEHTISHPIFMGKSRQDRDNREGSKP